MIRNQFFILENEKLKNENENLKKEISISRFRNEEQKIEYQKETKMLKNDLIENQHKTQNEIEKLMTETKQKLEGNINKWENW